MTTRLVGEEPLLEKSTRLLEMSVGERPGKNRAFVIIVEVVRASENVDES